MSSFALSSFQLSVLLLFTVTYLLAVSSLLSFLVYLVFSFSFFLLLLSSFHISVYFVQGESYISRHFTVRIIYGLHFTVNKPYLFFLFFQVFSSRTSSVSFTPLPRSRLPCLLGPSVSVPGFPARIGTYPSIYSPRSNGHRSDTSGIAASTGTRSFRVPGW